MKAIEIDIDLLELPRRNLLPKLSVAEVTEAKRYGIVRPVIVRPIHTESPLSGQRYEILSNTRSYVLAAKLNLRKVPVCVRSDITDVAAVCDDPAAEKEHPLLWAERVEREILNRPGQRLRQADVAEMFDLPKSVVSHRLRLLRLSARVKKMYKRGELPDHAVKLLVTLTPEKQLNVARLIASRKLKARDVELLVRSARSTHNSSHTASAGKNSVSDVTADRARKKDADTLALESRLSEMLGSKVRLDSEGRLIVDFFENLEVLVGIVERLGVVMADLPVTPENLPAMLAKLSVFIGCPASVNAGHLVIDYKGDLDCLDGVIRNLNPLA